MTTLAYVLLGIILGALLLIVLFMRAAWRVAEPDEALHVALITYETISKLAEELRSWLRCYEFRCGLSDRRRKHGIQRGGDSGDILVKGARRRVA